MNPFLIAGVACFFAFAHTAHAATLTSLLGSGSLTQGDVSFSNFAFTDNNASPLAGDFTPDTDNIFVTTSATATTTTLMFDFDPEIAISGINPDTSQELLFDFFIDFTVSVSAASSRTLTGVTFGDGDLSTSGTEAFAEVAFHDSVPIPVDPRVGSEATDTWILPDLSSLSLFGRIEGETGSSDSSSGLSTFALTFDLDGTRPITPVPLPASLPLILAGLGSLVFLRRRKRV